jgi:anti-sigma regulatory factor (Ser/Thr protein kinase)
MTATASTPAIDLRLPARAANISVVRQVLRDLGERLELDELLLEDLVLAASEACSNVVMHAYPLDEDGQLHVRATVGEDGIALVVRDRGRGRGTAGPGLGVGLSIIAAVARSLEIATDGAGWREVHMTFPLQRDGARADRDDDLTAAA